MAARLGQKLDVKEARAVELAAAGRSTQDMVQAAAATMVAYVVRHHAFLRGALDWKFSHHTYLILVETLSDLHVVALERIGDEVPAHLEDRKSTRLNSSHVSISYAVFCLQKKSTHQTNT